MNPNLVNWDMVLNKDLLNQPDVNVSICRDEDYNELRQYWLRKVKRIEEHIDMKGEKSLKFLYENGKSVIYLDRKDIVDIIFDKPLSFEHEIEKEFESCKC
jgi:hypothetical protein